MAASLTPKQAETLEFVRGFIARHGFAPSYAQIGNGVGIHAKSSVHRLICGLAERGRIRRHRDRPRSIEIIELNPLDGFSTAALIDEIRRRGVDVPHLEMANPEVGDGAAVCSHGKPRQPFSAPVHADGYAWGEARNNG